ncbi:MAG: M24 family metallopeptidase [Anaerolineae bacterium]
MKVRLDKLRQKLVEEELDAILITQPENRRYLSGFTGSAGVLLISAEQAILATDFRYYEQAAREAPYFQLAKIKSEEKFVDILPHLVAQVGARQVGFESAHLTFDQYEEWAKVAEGFDLVPTKEWVEELRAVKDEGELEAIRRAVALADEAMAHILGFMEPGMTERAVAWEIETYMRTHGADKAAFDIIVASGPNGAMPHAQASDAPIRADEPIVMDIGARIDGYHSDLTRTVCLGAPDDRFREIYDIVLRAQLAAEEGIKAGMTGKEADALARSVIEEAGYGEYSGHGLGHGVGLAIHEKPRLSKLSEEVLQPGMVFTVEPGIYLSDWGGVRLEDMVVIGQEGVEVLTQASKGVGE